MKEQLTRTIDDFLFDKKIMRKPALLLDTGFIIDLEQTSDGYALLEKLSGQYKLLVTDGVVGEVRRHHDVFVKNGRQREISDKMYNLVERVYSDSADVLSCIKAPENEEAVDNLRYNIHWAYLESATQKKIEVDPMSPVDKETLLTALALTDMTKEYRVGVLSPDAHISATLARLSAPGYKAPNRGYEHVKSFSL